MGRVLDTYVSRLDAGYEALVPLDGKTVCIAGATFHYVDRGTGPTIVMVHGLGGQLRNFSHGLLDRLVASHRIILIDRPGAGYSVAAPGDHPGIIEQAKQIASLLAALDIKQPLVVGHSFGGAIALALALDYPDRVGALALLAPLTQPHLALPGWLCRWVLRSHRLRRGTLRLLASPGAKFIAPWRRRSSFSPEQMPRDFEVTGGMLLALRLKSLDAAACEVAIINRDLSRSVLRYGDLSVPTSVLFGIDDNVLDPDVHGAKLVHQNPAIQIGMIPGGHMFPVTQPDFTAAWIRSVSTASSEEEKPSPNPLPQAGED